MFVIIQEEGPVFMTKLQFLALEGDAVLFPEDRDQHFVFEPSLCGMPVYVEEVGVLGGGTVFEDVHPPGVLPTLDVHVVRHDVENVPHFKGAQDRHEPIESLFTAYPGVDYVGVYDFVSVAASSWCHEIGRRVYIADAQVAQVGNEPCRVVIGNAVAELKPVRRDGDPRRKGPSSYFQPFASLLRKRDRHRMISTCRFVRHVGPYPPASPLPAIWRPR